MDARLMAIVAEGERGRVYLPPSEAMEAVARQAKPQWKPEGDVPARLTGGTCVPYGLAHWGDLFTPRQLVALTTFTELVQAARERVQADASAAGLPDDGKLLDAGGAGVTAYADSLAVYLSFAVSKALDRNSSLCFWERPMDRLRGTFGRQALPMVWDYAETNPFAGAGGDFCGTAKSLCEVLDQFVLSVPTGVASQSDARVQKLTHDTIASSDPPYYDNIGYADLSDFFYVWLRSSLKSVYPDLFATLSVPKAEELVATPYRHGSRAKAERFFLDGMTQAMGRLAEQAHPGFPVTIYYAFRQSESDGEEGTASTGWDTFLDAVIRAGFAISGTWPIRTEQLAGLKGRINALASSIILVCRPLAANAPTAARREFDADTRWAVAWFEQSGFVEGEYGVAETLSKAKNTSVAGMVQAGILTSSHGKVRLLKPDELPTDWDPTTDLRLTAWEMVHHLVRSLGAGGEGAAATLLAKIGAKAETARELCYRLYTLCERKKRAPEALSYNGLVQSWPEIARLAQEGGKPRTEQAELFE